MLSFVVSKENRSMRLMSILSGNSFVMYNKEIAQSVSVNGAIIFGQLCSSYESFSSKNMLKMKDGKEYFYLTAETLEGETALSYKQQVKAIKELEESGYIETKLMGTPARKHFYITDKIVNELLKDSSSAKREELKQTEPEPEPLYETLSFDKMENQVMPKGQNKPVQKVTAIKKKNKKEKNKKNNDKDIHCNNCNKEPMTIDRFRDLLTNACNELYTKFSIGKWNKEQWNILINKFVNDTIESGRYENVPEEKIKGYAYSSLETISNNSHFKHSKELQEELDMIDRIYNDVPTLYNWLENDYEEQALEQFPEAHI